MVPMPHPLQQAATASQLAAHSASLCTLQSLAKQGQAGMAAIHQRVLQWAQMGDNPEGVHQPDQRSAIGFMTRSGYHDRATSIQAELQLRQQHALRHISGCSPQAPSYPAVTSDTRLLWPPSVDMEQGCNSRDPRQDPDARGVKRLCSAHSMSTSPVHPRLCFAASYPKTGVFNFWELKHEHCQLITPSFVHALLTCCMASKDSALYKYFDGATGGLFVA